MSNPPTYDYGMLLNQVSYRDGPVDACHIIEKQTIKRVYSRGAVRVEAGVGYTYRPLGRHEERWSVHEFDFVEPQDIIGTILMDVRNVIAGMRRSFHTPFDNKDFRLPKSMLPVGFDDFVNEYALHVQAEERVDAIFVYVM